MAWVSRTQFLGMNSLRRSTELAPGEAASIINGDMGSSSLAAPAKGYQKYGNNANAADSIVRKYTYVKGDGVEIQLQVRDDGTNYILEYLNPENVTNSTNGEWEILEAGLSRSRTLSDGSTVKAHFGFAPFNDTGSNQLAYGNGVEAMRIWNGAIGEIASTAASTITLDGTTTTAQRGFSSTGSLTINGTTYTYSGVSTNQFTGVSPNPTGEANGSGVAQQVDSSSLSGADKGSILMSSQARLFLAGITATPNQVTFSDVGDLTNYSGSTPSDGGFEDFPQMNGDITALSFMDDWVIVFSERKIIAFRFEFPSSTTRVTIIKDIADEGCSSPKAVRKLGDQIWYITPNGGLKRLTQVSSENVFNVEDITTRISPTIEDFVWDDASLEYSQKERVFVASGKQSSDVSNNDRAVTIYRSLNSDGTAQLNLGILDTGISDMTIYGGDIHFGSPFVSESFRLFDGYSKNGASYIWKRVERTELFGDFWKKKWIKLLGVRGAIASGATLNISVAYGINGSVSVQEMQITGTDSGFVIQSPLNVLGGFELGTEPLGGTIEEIGDLNPFKVKFELPHIYVEDIQITFSTDGTGQQVVVDAYGFDVYDAEQHDTADEIKGLGN